MTEQVATNEPKPVNTDPTESYKKMVEFLNDPKEVIAAAARLGLKVSSGQEPAKKPEETLEEPEAVELPENADTATIIKAFNESMKRQKEYLTKKHSIELDKVKKEQVDRERAKISADVQKFAGKAKHFKELYNDIEAFFNTGKYSIEEAYKKALKLNDKDDPEMGITIEKKPNEAPNQDLLSRLSSPKISDEASDDEDKAPKYKTTTEAVRANLKEMISSDPKVAQLINEENS